MRAHHIVCVLAVLIMVSGCFGPSAGPRSTDVGAPVKEVGMTVHVERSADEPWREMKVFWASEGDDKWHECRDVKFSATRLSAKIPFEEAGFLRVLLRQDDKTWVERRYRSEFYEECTEISAMFSEIPKEQWRKDS